MKRGTIEPEHLHVSYQTVSATNLKPAFISLLALTEKHAEKKHDWGPCTLCDSSFLPGSLHDCRSNTESPLVCLHHVEAHQNAESV